MRISIDRDLCMATGVCESMAPELFQVNNEAVLDVVERALTADEILDVERALRLCPTSAISLK